MNKPAPGRRPAIPSVDRVLRSTECARLLEQYGRQRVTDNIRVLLARYRAEPSQSTDGYSIAGITGAVAAELADDQAQQLGPVFNLTGTVLHTNLGRSILPPEAIEAIIKTAANPSNLEYDLESGQRGDRDSHTEKLLCEITGAEAATVVNNNAAAVLLVLNTLAFNRQVTVSRGELVEIGGSFRVPDIMSRAGCTLVEVGTTNRTHPKDYRNAITPQSALLMKVHTSNYRIQGFTSSVSDAEVAEIAHESGLPFVCDLGSGTLIDLTGFGLPAEPTVQATLQAGADLVTFSGDKLLGGPQAGIIVGCKSLVDQLKANPLKRALRVDKMTIAALHAVLRLYQDPDRLKQKLPTLRILSRELKDIEATGLCLLPVLMAKYSGIAGVTLVDCHSQIGSGSMPLDLLPSKAIAIKPIAGKGDGQLLQSIAGQLRSLPVPVIGRISNGSLLLDLRCLDDSAGFLAQLDLLETGQGT